MIYNLLLRSLLGRLLLLIFDRIRVVKERLRLVDFFMLKLRQRMGGGVRVLAPTVTSGRGWRSLFALKRILRWKRFLRSDWLRGWLGLRLRLLRLRYKRLRRDRLLWECWWGLKNLTWGGEGCVVFVVVIVRAEEALLLEWWLWGDVIVIQNRC